MTTKKKEPWKPSLNLENKQHELFVKQYLACGMKGAEAARLAKYSEKSAKKIAWKLLQREDIQQRIYFLQKDRIKRLDLDADYLLLHLVEALEMDLIDIIDDDGSLKSVEDMPPTWRKYIQGIEIVELFEGRGEDREQVGYLKKIKWVSKEKILEMLGKHVSIQAFRERFEHEGNLSHNFSDEGLQSFAERVARGIKGQSTPDSKALH